MVHSSNPLLCFCPRTRAGAVGKLASGSSETPSQWLISPITTPTSLRQLAFRRELLGQNSGVHAVAMLRNPLQSLVNELLPQPETCRLPQPKRLQARCKAEGEILIARHNVRWAFPNIWLRVWQRCFGCVRNRLALPLKVSQGAARTLCRAHWSPPSHPQGLRSAVQRVIVQMSNFLSSRPPHSFGWPTSGCRST